VSWSTTGYQSKVWTAQTLPGTPFVDYTIKDLTPNNTYVATIGIPIIAIATNRADTQDRITFHVMNGTPSVNTTNTYTIVIDKENTAPVLPSIANHTINELTVVSITNRATDVDMNPPALLSYALSAVNVANNAAITNAKISSNNVIT